MPLELPRQFKSYPAPQQYLTLRENAAIMPSLFVWEAKEKRLARHVVWLQLSIVLIITGIAYSCYGTLQCAAAVLSGGLVSVLNSALLAWRMSGSASHSAHEAHHSGSAHLQLRSMYLYAVERFLVVFVMLGACMMALKLSPLALIGGFVAGQSVLLVARLFLIKLN